MLPYFSWRSSVKRAATIDDIALVEDFDVWTRAPRAGAAFDAALASGFLRAGPA
jgi:hypothetical protein